MYEDDDRGMSILVLAGKPFVSKDDAYFILGNFGCMKTGNKKAPFAPRPDLLIEARALAHDIFNKEKMAMPVLGLEAMGQIVMASAPETGICGLTVFRNTPVIVEKIRENGFIMSDSNLEFFENGRVRGHTSYYNAVKAGMMLEKEFKNAMSEYVVENFVSNKKITAYDGYEKTIAAKFNKPALV